MTLTTTTVETPRAKIDWTKPVLWLFAACLVVLIVMPLSWLAVYSVTDKTGAPDAAEFRHAVHRSGFSRSAADHRDHRHHARP